MKILLYGLNFAPELTGIGKYTGEMAAWLAARGHVVRVVTAPPHYPDWKVSEGFRNWWSSDTDFVIASDGRQSTQSGLSSLGTPRNHALKVYRCPLWVPRQPDGSKRLLHLASFALSSLPVLLAQVVWRPQVVWVVEPALICAPGAVALARICGAKVWLHVQDFEVDAAFDLGLLRGAWLRRLVAGAERWLMRRFDVVSTISQKMHQRLLDKGVAANKVRLAVNWVNMPEFASPSLEGVASYRRELNVPVDAVVAMYSGNMGGKQGLEVLAAVAKTFTAEGEVLGQNIVFVFCGNGTGRADLVKGCAGLPNVRFVGLQPSERMPYFLAMADIHLLPQRADAADLVMPSKLTSMLASARPVIATAHAGTELATVVENCGLVVPPEDPLAFAKAVRTLAEDPELRERLGAAGYVYAQAYLDKEAVLAKFEAELLEMTG
jgi:colanic acid biosynthesis glycosyl transferase WcaI